MVTNVTPVAVTFPSVRLPAWHLPESPVASRPLHKLGGQSGGSMCTYTLLNLEWHVLAPKSPIHTYPCEQSTLIRAPNHDSQARSTPAECPSALLTEPGAACDSAASCSLPVS